VKADDICCVRSAPRNEVQERESFSVLSPLHVNVVAVGVLMGVGDGAFPINRAGSTQDNSGQKSM
jgi:hypothetical protein